MNDSRGISTMLIVNSEQRFDSLGHSVQHISPSVRSVLSSVRMSTLSLAVRESKCRAASISDQ